jgi:murein DD-endopeptidase MepM/ murein hydrolase activator NlpD
MPNAGGFQGDFVARGQWIGYAGQTGDVSTPQVHFEIRSATGRSIRGRTCRRTWPATSRAGVSGIQASVAMLSRVRPSKKIRPAHLPNPE